jgi:hypothetical protein
MLGLSGNFVSSMSALALALSNSLFLELQLYIFLLAVNISAMDFVLNMEPSESGLYSK